MSLKVLPKVNFIVEENWYMICPHCQYEQNAPFNHDEPMSPYETYCKKCNKSFILTYERE